MDAEGYLYFVGRNDDIIKSRGEKVSPKEVEEVLYELPDIVDAAVVGIPDPVLGEAVTAFVTLGPGAALTEAALMGHCDRRLERHMVPDRIVLVDALPRTPTGKIDRRALTTVAGPA
jgi:acyl-coenzyme A synthetase/AMP-(fatty) acid ligase